MLLRTVLLFVVQCLTYFVVLFTEQVDEALTPAPLTDKSLEANAIFDVPIIVVPGKIE